MGKPVGRYVTLELDGLVRREEDAFQRAVRAVAGEVEAMAPRAGTVLVMGLGNRAVTPDLIGPLAAEQVLVTRYLVEHLAEHFGHLRAVAAVSPGVLASTGIESAAVATALVRQLKPSCVVAIDALASRAIDRLCRTVQLSDTGIAPGSGVGNHRVRAESGESGGAGDRRRRAHRGGWGHPGPGPVGSGGTGSPGP